MSEDLVQEPTTIHELTEKSRKKMAAAQEGASDVLASTAGYIRANPWAAVAGAAILGAALVTLSRRSKPESRSLHIRDWLDEAYAKLPTRDEVKSLADSSGVPCFLKQLGKKLHFTS